jgi:branched-chain amino acid transport system permease protein
MFMYLLIDGLVVGSIYGIMALGYSLIYKASGLMTFTQGDLMTLGAFLGITFYSYLHLPFLVSLVLTVLIVFLLGMGLEKFVIRRLISKNVHTIYVVLATIAVSYIIQNASQMFWGTTILKFPAIFPITSIKLFGTIFQTESIFCLLISIVIMVALHLYMKKTKFGTAMRAAALDSTAARACGINVNLSTGISWGLSAGIAAVAGMLVGPLYGVFTTLGYNMGMKGFSAAIIGGYGNMYGAILGGTVLGLVETFTSGYISSEYKNLIAYVLLLVFLFVKPMGIFNERSIEE